MRARAILAGFLISPLALASCTGTPAKPAFRPRFEPTPCPKSR